MNSLFPFFLRASSATAGLSRALDSAVIWAKTPPEESRRVQKSPEESSMCDAMLHGGRISGWDTL